MKIAVQYILLVAFMVLMVSGVARAEDKILSVEINKGQMVKLDRPASSVVIADPATADVQVVSPKLLFIHGKKVGETSLYVVDAQDNPIVSITVDVTHNLSELARTVKRVAPDSDVTFKTVDGGLVMDGYAGTVAESEHIGSIASAYIGSSEKMLNMVKTGGSDQVMLKVKFVEMSRNDLKNLGVNLQNITSNGNFGMQLLQGPEILFHPNNVDTTPDVYNQPTSVIDRGSSTNTNLFLKYKGLSGVIDALETQGMASVLAEPNLTTTSGQAASFLAGGQFPIPVVQSSTGGAPVVTIQYQPFGVSLKFTPVVMGHDRISLTVAPEVSTLDFNNPIEVSGVRYPILDTRQASAVVELGSGDSFMLAGLLQSQTNNTINKFPGLGDLPVLGALFRSTQFQNNQTDLVIMVTPYIVHPVADGSKLQTPMDGYKPPSDLERLLYGSLYEQEPMHKKKKAVDADIGADQPTAKADFPEQPHLHGEGGFLEK